MKRKLLPLLLIAVGALVVGVSLGVDLARSGQQAEFGRRQLVLLVGGLATLLVGLVLLSPFGQRYILQRRALSAAHDQPVSPLLVATFFALIAGFSEILILATRSLLFRELIYTGAHYPWMALVANLVIYFGLGLLLLLLGRHWPVFVSLPVTSGAFAFLCSLALLWMFPAVDSRASLLLATGLAVQASRLASKHPRRFKALVRYAVGWLVLTDRGGRSQANQPASTAQLPTRRHFVLSTAAVVAGITLGVGLREGLAEIRATGAVPPASARLPNVLLVVLDTVRAKSLSLLGHQRRTSPKLEHLATTGVSFEWALSTAPWTLASHASMFTGRWPSETSVRPLLPLDGRQATLAEVLGRHGYLTAGFVANLMYCPREFGIARGFQHYEDYPVSAGQIALSASLGRKAATDLTVRQVLGYHDPLNRKTAQEINGAFLRWLTEQKQQPFFAFLNYFDAHEPYLPADLGLSIGGNQQSRPLEYFTNIVGRGPRWMLTREEAQAEVALYEAGIKYVDQQLGLLLQELERRDLLENTLVVVTSDHGEEFGEHTFFGHGATLYLPSLHVPLLLSFPARLRPGVSVKEPVSLRDLPATITDLLGIQSPGFPGQSLTRFLGSAAAGGSAGAQPVFSETVTHQERGYPDGLIPVGRQYSLLSGQFHYLRHEHGTEELYNVQDDPWEQHDLAQLGVDRQILDDFKAQLGQLAGNRTAVS
jgi:arylsulfatase A-like enzyme